MKNINELYSKAERVKESRGIKPDISLEEIREYYLDENFRVPSESKIYRLDYKGGRFYVEIFQLKEKDGSIKNHYRSFPSVTHIIGRLHQRSEFLTRWIATHPGGYDGARKEFKLAGSYGTTLHILWQNILIGESIRATWNNLEPIIEAQLMIDGFKMDDIKPDEWHGKIKQDLLGIVSFIRDYKIQPIAVEQVLTEGGELPYAGAVDLICELTLPEKIKKKYDDILELALPEKLFSVIDLKSGRNGAYNDYPVQLQAYKRMAESYYNRKVDLIANLNMKNYRIPIGKTVTPYDFTIQNTAIEAKYWNHYLQMFYYDPKNFEIKTSTEIDDLDFSINMESEKIYREINPVEKFLDIELF